MTSTVSLAQLFTELAIFGAPEAAVTDLVQRRSEATDDLVLIALGLAIWAHRNGHPCVHLGDVGGLVGKDLSEDDLKLLLGLSMLKHKLLYKEVIQESLLSLVLEICR